MSQVKLFSPQLLKEEPASAIFADAADQREGLAEALRSDRLVGSLAAAVTGQAVGENRFPGAT